MSEDEPDIKRENLADSDESPFGDTTEHAGEQDTDKGETYHDPEGEGEDGTDRETRPAARTAPRAPAPARRRAARACRRPIRSGSRTATDA